MVRLKRKKMSVYRCVGLQRLTVPAKLRRPRGREEGMVGGCGICMYVCGTRKYSGRCSPHAFGANRHITFHPTQAETPSCPHRQKLLPAHTGRNSFPPTQAETPSLPRNSPTYFLAIIDTC
jgi:hypothetical protein